MNTNTAVVIDPKEFGLEENQAKEIESNFLPVIAERDNLAKTYEEIVAKEISKELIPVARELRLKLVKVRAGTDAIHKTAKAFYLSGGRFVDAWKNKNVTVIEQMESKLSEIENYYVNIEKQRVADLKIARTAILSEVCENPALYQVELMTEEAFTGLIEGLKLAKEKREAEAAQAEAARLAAIEAERFEQERIRKENEALRIEAERKAKEHEAELAKLEAERKSAEEKARKEREAAEAAAAKAKAEAEAKLEAERKEKAKLEAELKAKAEAEAKAKAEQQANEKKAASAPDKAKLTALAETFKGVTMPELKTPEAITILTSIAELQGRLVKYITDKAETL